MSKRVRRRRGTQSQHDEFVGADGELTVNTTDYRVHAHDGSTAGGFATAREDEVSDLSGVSDASTARSNLGLGSAATESDTKYVFRANNLSDLGNASTARTNLGLGSAATQSSEDVVGSRFPNVDADVTATEDDLNKLTGLSGPLLAYASAPSELKTSRDDNTWYTNSSGRHMLLTIVGQADAAGGSIPGALELWIDYSGGTTQDVEVYVATGGSDHGITGSVTMFIPEGASYKLWSQSSANSSIVNWIEQEL